MKIALLGDSMVDTLFFQGRFLELEKLLERGKKINLELLNYGVGSTDIKRGLYRITHDYDYKERARYLPSLISQKPEVVIVESFAYNHWSDSQVDIEKYLSIHRKILETLETNLSTLILYLSPICPNKKLYVKGIPTLGWSEAKRLREYKTTRLYLDKFVEFAGSTAKPLIDCYSASIKRGDGDPQLVSNVDGLHNSLFSRLFVAKKISKTLGNIL